MMHIDAISPAANELAEWNSRFLRFATEQDAMSVPLKGSFGIDFSCNKDLRTAATPAARRELVKHTIGTNHQEKEDVAINISVRQVVGAYESFHPGTLVALKKGMTVIAFIRIVSEYRYEDELSGGNAPHRWDYERVRMALPSEQPDRGNLRLTYVPKCVPIPADLIAPAVLVVEEVPAAEEECEMRLIDGTIYWVNGTNVYKYDEDAEEAGDYLGQLTADETIDMGAAELSSAALAMLNAHIAAFKKKEDALVARIVKLRNQNVSLKEAAEATSAAQAAVIVARDAEIAKLRDQNAAFKKALCIALTT
jgi:hypothetical protein